MVVSFPDRSVKSSLGTRLGKWQSEKNATHLRPHSSSAHVHMITAGH